MHSKISLMIFRRDLRMTDNPALVAAAKEGNPLICLFVWDPDIPNLERLGSASRWWLHHSLLVFAEQLQHVGNRLIICRGHLKEVIPLFVRRYRITHMFWNQSYEPGACQEEMWLQKWAKEHGKQTFTFNGNLLIDPDVFGNLSGKPYTVFTPFWNRLQKSNLGGISLPAPRRLPGAPKIKKHSSLSSLHLTSQEDRMRSLGQIWRPGEDGAKACLKSFIRNSIMKYQTDRDRPDRSHTSKLSPYLHFGEISPRYVWKKIQNLTPKVPLNRKESLVAFKRQLAWREFGYHLLVHFPQLPNMPLRAQYTRFPWKANTKRLAAWQNGQTGYPLIDAGMRELLKTGWMHNRVRMVVASFLTKHLLLPWQKGAAWFWETLVDADLANNTLGWQWAAGCGPDAAPFFRIFNPMIQGQKFDPAGVYVRRWVPELTTLPNTYIHRPWEASTSTLKEAGVTLGKTYPVPIVDHQKARDTALIVFHQFQRSQKTLDRTPQQSKDGN